MCIGESEGPEDEKITAKEAQIRVEKTCQFF
jgi:hypothetical protein